MAGIALLVTMVVLAGPLRAGTTGRLAGRVLDKKKQPLTGVNLVIPTARVGAATDAEGRSRLAWRRRAKDDVPPGPTPREVVVTSPGFAASVAEVVFDSAARDALRIELLCLCQRAFGYVE